ncbi:ras association domain-containing protein 7 isoform X1 [Octodon degus]|uniref:Ras association domain-containing protein 7 n=1 Tax=Octodon degus TaxID=10160 RepID=A0A6P6F1N6_OCTDE|nr:ras association domain-containing protein 7 isoform X1 [Octodon degus]XP_023578536.1 ras association domain-containing protein 7 isoform X1 [Octodon degus]
MVLGLSTMELKVWVDGIQRVVCGVSEQTTCQDVVIALAQAIGQTGRFVLVQRLKEKERQLLPQECPVDAQATCGQLASDVQFVLRRTGPSLAGRPSSDSCPPPERCPVRASLPPKPRATPDQRSHRALTFSLGCPKLAPNPSSSESPAPGAPNLGCCEDIQSMELRVHRNAEELGHEAFWEQELKWEEAREREGQARLQALSAATAEHAAQLQALDAQARALEAELLVAEAPVHPSATLSATERLRQDLAIQERQSVEVQGSLALVSRALEAAECALQGTKAMGLVALAPEVLCAPGSGTRAGGTEPGVASVQPAAVYPADGSCTAPSSTAREIPPWHTGPPAFIWSRPPSGSPPEPSHSAHPKSGGHYREAELEVAACAPDLCRGSAMEDKRASVVRQASGTTGV